MRGPRGRSKPNTNEARKDVQCEQRADDRGTTALHQPVSPPVAWDYNSIPSLEDKASLGAVQQSGQEGSCTVRLDLGLNSRSPGYGLADLGRWLPLSDPQFPICQTAVSFR